MTPRSKSERPSGDNRAGELADDLDAWLATHTPRLRGRNRLILADTVRTLRRIAEGET